MSIWLTILKRLLDENKIPSDENIGGKIRKLLYGSLTLNDSEIADNIMLHVFGKDFKPQDDKEHQAMIDDIAKHLESMGLANNEPHARATVSLIRNIRSRSSTFLCAPTMIGKTVVLKVMSPLGLTAATLNTSFILIGC